MCTTKSKASANLAGRQRGPNRPDKATWSLHTRRLCAHRICRCARGVAAGKKPRQVERLEMMKALSLLWDEGASIGGLLQRRRRVSLRWVTALCRTGGGVEAEGNKTVATRRLQNYFYKKTGDRLVLLNTSNRLNSPTENPLKLANFRNFYAQKGRNVCRIK